MTNILTFDVEEFFHSRNISASYPRSQWEQLPQTVVVNTHYVLGALARAGTHATFFCLGWVAAHHPGLLRDIASAGHEIGTHGYWHELVYEQSPEEFERDVADSLAAIRAAVPAAIVRSYRAPVFSIVPRSAWALPILHRLGLRFDSSIHPVSWHDRYGWAGSPRGSWRHPDGLVEVPPATLQMGRMNLPIAGGGYFRLLPYRATAQGIAWMNRAGLPSVVYLHPWEFDPVPRGHAGAGWSNRFRQNCGLRTARSKLDRLLAEFEFGPLERHPVVAALLADPGQGAAEA